jgi:hypothetical protein
MFDPAPPSPLPHEQDEENVAPSVIRSRGEIFLTSRVTITQESWDTNERAYRVSPGRPTLKKFLSNVESFEILVEHQATTMAHPPVSAKAREVTNAKFHMNDDSKEMPLGASQEDPR